MPSEVTASLQRKTLTILFCVSVLNFLDRYMFGILLPSIKTELSLSDTQLGFVTGVAFAIFYATMGIPIARLADRTTRRGVLSAAITMWSTMTVVTGLAQNLWQLSIARLLMGLGEAGATPPSHAIIGELFPRAKRGAALAIYGMGSPVGLMIGFMGGGWVSQHYGWRTALVVFGLPGLILALIVRLKLVEPPRAAAPPGPAANLVTVVKELLKRRAFVHNTIGGALYALLGLGTTAWAPSFFVRVHHMPIAEVGFWLAIVLGISQIGGMLTGGLISDKLGAKDVRWYPWTCMVAVIVAGPFFGLAFLAESATAGLAWLFVPFFLGQTKFGPQGAITQGIAESDRRAVAAAVFFMINGLAGGLGAQIIGILSDRFRPEYGDRALGYAITAVAATVSLWAAFHFWRASQTIRDDVAG